MDKTYTRDNFVPSDLIFNEIESFRFKANKKLDPDRKSSLGQFTTSQQIAELMASMLSNHFENVSILDPGAGVGSLSSALAISLCKRQQLPSSISITAYEIEPVFIPYLKQSYDLCQVFCEKLGIGFNFHIHQKDFVEDCSDLLQYEGTLFENKNIPRYSFAILNPPYHKINSQSKTRKLLTKTGIEISNLYAAFVWLSIRLLHPNGQLVAITPRSFCNGPYFKLFRKYLLLETSIRKIHIFELRNKAFQLDDVLQENIIYHLEKGGTPSEIEIVSSLDPSDELPSIHHVAYNHVVDLDDPNLIINIPTTGMDAGVISRINLFSASLDDLGITVSTGRVVDFRTKSNLRNESDYTTVPLIYPHNFHEGNIKWPVIKAKKPIAIANNRFTKELLLPKGYYVLVRRFSSKEESRRVVAALCDPSKLNFNSIGFENHLNVFHASNHGLDRYFAIGLTIFLNSTLVDLYFRRFNGHTQVNATDLKMLNFPDRGILIDWGIRYSSRLPNQYEIDQLISDEANSMSVLPSNDPVLMKQKVDEALEIIELLGLPRGQQNERSALTLLALINLKPEMPWNQIQSPLIGITPIMDFISDVYKKTYAPNSRETVRRQTMHQFAQAGIAIMNPDDPDRPINSPKWCYQIEPAAFNLVKTYGTAEWEFNLSIYLKQIITLQEQYAMVREMRMIPVKLLDGTEIILTPGKHNDLTKAVIEEFIPRYVSGSVPVYVGDTGYKFAFQNESLLADLGIDIDSHGKMPDLVFYSEEKDWLFLIEVVISHGPVDSKRRIELAELFKNSKPRLIYVTAFQSRRIMTKYIKDISWETEVWVHESPTHIIHFDGEKFLEPYI